MSDPLALVQRWRDLAEELTRLADTMEFPSAKAGIMKAAANYIRMADELEQLLRASAAE